MQSEVDLRRTFKATYQSLANTFRSDTFGANLPTDDRAWEYVRHFLDSTTEYAIDLFTRVLVPAGNMGAAEGEREVERGRRRWGFWKAGGQSTAARSDQVPTVPVGTGSITPLYPGSFPSQVPPRRQLLRIPKPRIIIQPTSQVGRFTSAPQVHLDAVSQLPIDLVTLIDDSQREGIRTTLDEAIRHGYDPDMIGMQIANMVGLFPRWQNAVVNLGNGMRAKGKSEKEIAYRMGRYSDWLRERRGIMIARTELMTALNTGRIAGWYQQADQGLLDPTLSSKEWLDAPGSCEICHALAGTKVVGLDSLFDTPFGKVKSGPCHPHCRCVTLLHPVRNPSQYLNDA